MRGARRWHGSRRFRRGIIPAYAGSTRRRRCSGHRPRDHPRVCGEHAARIVDALQRPGSSPRMRGAQKIGEQMAAGTGIIPAYAGSTVGSAMLTSMSRDHPRVCGEHSFFPPIVIVVSGSSPRMRGARRVHDDAAPRVGIIPAYAGSTRAASSTAMSSRDHPRVCGEHRRSCTPRWSREGSSPRMRGAPSPTPALARRMRIIPAYAGSTYLSIVSTKPNRDHPRVCGEHISEWAANQAETGSSPRMRGAQASTPVPKEYDGIIPAYAGSTVSIC